MPQSYRKSDLIHGGRQLARATNKIRTKDRKMHAGRKAPPEVLAQREAKKLSKKLERYKEQLPPCLSMEEHDLLGTPAKELYKSKVQIQDTKEDTEPLESSMAPYLEMLQIDNELIDLPTCLFTLATRGFNWFHYPCGKSYTIHDPDHEEKCHFCGAMPSVSLVLLCLTGLILNTAQVQGMWSKVQPGGSQSRGVLFDDGELAQVPLRPC